MIKFYDLGFGKSQDAKYDVTGSESLIGSDGSRIECCVMQHNCANSCRWGIGITVGLLPLLAYRDRILNVNWFLSLDDAKEKIRLFKEEYNGFRPHSSLSGLTPNEVVQQHSNGPTFSILGR